MSEPNDPFARFIGEVLIGQQHAREREASGWIVVVIDTEQLDSEQDRGVISAYGPCPTPEQALALAGEFDADPHTGKSPDDGSPGWLHIVVPLFEPL